MLAERRIIAATGLKANEWNTRGESDNPLASWPSSQGMRHRLNSTNFHEQIADHYSKQWGPVCRIQYPPGPKASDFKDKLRILVFEPSNLGGHWTYATSGIGLLDPNRFVEFHLHSLEECGATDIILAAVAHFHLYGKPLSWGHTVNLGIPWFERSKCSYGLISLPYLKGPPLEDVRVGNKAGKCYWLIPITEAERNFKVRCGLESLERAFETRGLDYLDPLRASMISESDNCP